MYNTFLPKKIVFNKVIPMRQNLGKNCFFNFLKNLNFKNLIKLKNFKMWKKRKSEQNSLSSRK